MEIELKLLLAPADNAELRRHPLLAGLPTRTQHLTAHYFDTPDLHLLRHGAGLRVRKEDGDWVQTMKAGGSVQSGLHQRHEWAGPVSRPWPQLRKLRKLIGDAPHWREVLAAKGLNHRLEALFEVVVQREIWQLAYATSEIELVLDCGHIERHGQQLAINEIELELKHGAPGDLFALALQLLERLPLQLSNANKAERGYALCRQSGTQASHARPVLLDAAATLAQAWRAVLQNCLQQVQDNQLAVIDSDDAEALHQIRVGTRRLRSALKLFEAELPCPAGMQDDWRWLAQLLGTARDWEVLGSATLARIQASPGGPGGLHDLPALVQAQVQEQRRHAARALQSPHYTRMLLEMGRWLLQGPALQDSTHRNGSEHASKDQSACGTARDYAQQTLHRLHKTLQKRARQMRDSDPASVHRTRIAAKRARYALEFFHSLYRGKALRQYLATLAAAQETLGQHNDLVVAERLLRQLAPTRAGTAEHIAFARGYLQALQAAQTPDLASVRSALHALPGF